MAKDRRFQSHATKDATLARRKPITEARKMRNRAANEAAAERNRELRAAGELTPFEAQKAARRARRDEARARGELPPIGTPREQWKRKGQAA